MKLTIKQRKFADNYIKSGNATESAIEAGYSKKTAAEIGYENLNKPHISSYIRNKEKEISNDKIASAEEVLELFTNIARGLEKEQKVVTIDGERTIIEVKPELRDRLKAAELLGKRYALFIDRQEIDMEVNKSLEDFFGDD